MVPHLVGAQSAYKYIMMHSLDHSLSHTHTLQIHALLGIGWKNRMRRKKRTHQHAEEKRWVFSFVLKEESEDESLKERGNEFQITGLMY